MVMRIIMVMLALSITKAMLPVIKTIIKSLRVPGFEEGKNDAKVLQIN